MLGRRIAVPAAVAAFAALAVTAVVVVGPTADAGSDLARYAFDTPTEERTLGGSLTATDGAVEDATGNGHTGYVETANGGQVTATDDGRGGLAARFPAPCHGRGCPKALIEVESTPSLDPGRKPFSYGARLLLAVSETSAGSNIVQKGFYGRGGQWKLQVDRRDGRPSCVVQGRLDGNETSVLVLSSVSVSDGQWHEVSCSKRRRAVFMTVDGVEVGRKTVRIGRVANTVPLHVGAKNLTDRNDQFFGVVDDVWFRRD